uniref:Mediator of RNA polymerase II transcription subunit 25 n=1 Tax=Meloidogyne hapla TaxID=6305 RepID=A0A1I8BAR7_MELHA
MSKIVFITDEGSNVSHLGGNKHHKCIDHILATISRHITQPYAAEKANDDVIAVESAIGDLHVFVSDLSNSSSSKRCSTPACCHTVALDLSHLSQKVVRDVAKQYFPGCLRPHVENVSPSLAAFGNDTMRTEIDYEMEQYQIGCKNLGGQKLDLLNFLEDKFKKIPSSCLHFDAFFSNTLFINLM